MNTEVSTNNIPFSCRVSSTINKDVKLFGKQFMFDGNDETCWNSDMGETQWIMLVYEKAITFSKMKIQFQGGFAAQQCHLEILNDDSVEFSKIVTFEDNNTFQNIDLLKIYSANKIKLKFNKMYDTYGRIIVYHLTFNT